MNKRLALPFLAGSPISSAPNFANSHELFRRFMKIRGREFLLYHAIPPRTGERRVSIGKDGQDAVRGERLHAGYRHSIPGAFGTAEWKAIVDYLKGAELRQSLDQAAKVQ